MTSRYNAVEFGGFSASTPGRSAAERVAVQMIVGAVLLCAWLTISALILEFAATLAVVAP